jgi:adenylylsulfate kinase-like enzyme
MNSRTHYLDARGDALKPVPLQAKALSVPLGENKRRVLLITGLPGSGKTSIAKGLATQLRGVHINADTVRETINKCLDFSEASRVKQAETMGHLAKIVADSGIVAVVDFVCPTLVTRQAVLNALGQHRPFTTWVEIHRPGLDSRFEDTKKLYVPLQQSVPDLPIHPAQVTTFLNEEGNEHQTRQAVSNFYWTCAHV